MKTKSGYAASAMQQKISLLAISDMMKSNGMIQELRVLKPNRGYKQTLSNMRKELIAT